MINRSFMADARCKGLDPELFHPGRGESTEPAKAVCSDCPVRLACLDYALAHRERHGVWGGLSERERRSLRRALGDVGERVCKRAGCGRTFTPRVEHQAYCCVECRRDLKNEKARRQRAA